jgi:hypothetical protein
MEDEMGPLSAEEVDLVKAAIKAGRLGQVKRARIVWPRPQPFTAAEIAAFEQLPQPKRFAPKTFEDEQKLRLAFEVWSDADFARCRALASLTTQQRSQLESDRKYRDPAEPYWLCEVKAGTEQTPESGIPPMLVRGKTAEEAGERYCHLCGLVGGRDGLLNEGGKRQDLVVTRETSC